MAREFIVWVIIILALTVIVVGLVIERVKSSPTNQSAVSTATPSVPIKHEEKFNY